MIVRTYRDGVLVDEQTVDPPETDETLPAEITNVDLVALRSAVLSTLAGVDGSSSAADIGTALAGLVAALGGGD